MSDNYMTESAMEVEAMHKAYTEALENGVVFEAAFAGFLAGGLLGALAAGLQNIALAAIAVSGAVGLAAIAIYWRRKMRNASWD